MDFLLRKIGSASFHFRISSFLVSFSFDDYSNKHNLPAPSNDCLDFTLSRKVVSNRNQTHARYKTKAHLKPFRYDFHEDCIDILPIVSLGTEAVRVEMAILDIVSNHQFSAIF